MPNRIRNRMREMCCSFLECFVNKWEKGAGAAEVCADWSDLLGRQWQWCSTIPPKVIHHNKGRTIKLTSGSSAASLGFKETPRFFYYQFITFSFIPCAICWLCSSFTSTLLQPNSLFQPYRHQQRQNSFNS